MAATTSQDDDNHGDSTTPAPDPELIRACWDALVSPGDVHEIRIPKTKRGPARLFKTVAGYFDNADVVLSALAGIGPLDAQAVYLTLNPVNPALLARYWNRMENNAELTTADKDILRLKHLLLDVDPVRPAGISATDEEQGRALLRRDAVRRFLRAEHGWPPPVLISESGNGGGLVYRIDLANTPEHVALLERVLKGVSALFSDATAKIDETTFNPSRITKLIGTVAAKGDHLPARPWRLATARFNPNPARIVTAAQLEAVAAHAPAEVSASARFGPPTDTPARAWDIRAVLHDSGVGFAERAYGTGRKFLLDRCLTSPDHCDGAAVFEYADGRLGYKCHHDSCAGKGWAEAKAALAIPRAPEAWRPVRTGKGAGFRGFAYRGGRLVAE